jgi:hypothetical protein
MPGRWPGCGTARDRLQVEEERRQCIKMYVLVPGVPDDGQRTLIGMQVQDSFVHFAE